MGGRGEGMTKGAVSHFPFLIFTLPLELGGFSLFDK